MRVLLADDGGEKFQRLQDFLIQDPNLGTLELVSAEDGFAARKAMRTTKFDLLILDILLPWRAGDDPTADGSSKLLNSVIEDETLIPPRQVVGLSADPAAAAAAGSDFAAKTWTVLGFDRTSNSWLEAIKSSLLYLLAQSDRVEEYGYDVMIISALRDPEMNAVHRLPWNWQAEEPLDDTTFMRRGSFVSNGSSYSVVTAVSDRMGMVSAAVLATKMIGKCRPRYCVMVGICAGIEAETRLGDVVLADPSWDYQSGKRIKEKDGTHKFKIDPHQLPVSLVIRSRIKQLALDKAALAAIRDERDDQPAHELRVLPGPMATGSAVISDEDLIAEIKDSQHRKVIAIEMEAYGLASAAHNAGMPKPTAFCLKSVSDFADQKKDDSAQKYAAHTSARVTQVFFERYMQELRDLAGR